MASNRVDAGQMVTDDGRLPRMPLYPLFLAIFGAVKPAFFSRLAGGVGGRNGRLIHRLARDALGPRRIIGRRAGVH